MAKKNVAVVGGEQEMLGFVVPPAKPLPKLVCVGRVDSFVDRNGIGGRVSKSEKYIWNPINIVALQGGQNARAGLTYRPAWFQLVDGKPFDPANIAEEAEYNVDDPAEKREAEKMLNVYRMNIAQKREEGMSVLQGITQTVDNFVHLANRLLHLGEVTIENVQQTLEQFFTEHDDILIGYVLKQQETRTGEFDEETGKEIRIKESRYELDRFFEYSPKAIESWKKSAAKSNGNIVVAFDPDGPMF